MMNVACRTVPVLVGTTLVVGIQLLVSLFHGPLMLPVSFSWCSPPLEISSETDPDRILGAGAASSSSSSFLGNNNNDDDNNNNRTDPPPPQHHEGFYVLNPEDFRPHLLPAGDYEWAIRNVPFIDFPDDEDVTAAYYYRWRSYRKHVAYTNDGYMITEFLPHVDWAGLHNTIPAAAGHHILEGRWIHDEAVLNDYIRFWVYHPDADPSRYTNWIGSSAWQRYLLNGNVTFISSLAEGLTTLFRDTYIPKYLRNLTIDHDDHNSSDSNGADEPSSPHRSCWFQEDGPDAMEASISGNGCRPTIASALFGEAETLVRLAALHQDSALQQEFRQWMEFSRSVILDLHWNANIQSFAVVPIATAQTENEDYPRINWTHSVQKEGCDLNAVRVPNRPVQVRELLGFIPWYFESLIPLKERHVYMPMWDALFDNLGFAAPYGLRTAEVRHACYNYSWDHGDCWNGPSWPYETSRVLTSVANILNSNQDRIGSNDESVDAEPFRLSKDDYWQLLWQYARQHTHTYADNDTAVPRGSGHIFENLHPDMGYWNNRARMYWKHDDNRNMGDDYNHSTFCDLVLSGLLGIRPQQDGSLYINPLVPPFVSTFAVDHVRVRGGHILSTTWNRVGDDGRGKYPPGLTVLVNGKVVAHRRDMGLLKIDSNQLSKIPSNCKPSTVS